MFRSDVRGAITDVGAGASGAIEALTRAPEAARL